MLVENDSGFIPFSNDPKIQRLLESVDGYNKPNPTDLSKILEKEDIFHLVLLNQVQEVHKRLENCSVEEVLKNHEDGKLTALQMLQLLYGNALPSLKGQLLALIEKMIQAGGEELVLKSKKGNNTLHYALKYACQDNSSVKIVKAMVEATGSNIIKLPNDDGDNSLHYACIYQAHEDVIEYLMENQDGTKALEARNKKRTRLTISYFNVPFLPRRESCFFNVDDTNKILHVQKA